MFWLLTPEIFSVTLFGLKKTATINKQCRQSCLHCWGCQAHKNQSERTSRSFFLTFERFRFLIALSLSDASDWPHTWTELCQNCYCGSQATTFHMLSVKFHILELLLLHLCGHQGLIAKPSQLRWFFSLTPEAFNSNPNLLIQTTHVTPALQEIELIR